MLWNNLDLCFLKSVQMLCQSLTECLHFLISTPGSHFASSTDNSNGLLAIHILRTTRTTEIYYGFYSKKNSRMRIRFDTWLYVPYTFGESKYMLRYILAVVRLFVRFVWLQYPWLSISPDNNEADEDCLANQKEGICNHTEEVHRVVDHPILTVRYMALCMSLFLLLLCGWSFQMRWCLVVRYKVSSGGVGLSGLMIGNGQGLLNHGRRIVGSVGILAGLDQLFFIHHECQSIHGVQTGRNF